MRLCEALRLPQAPGSASDSEVQVLVPGSWFQGEEWSELSEGKDYQAWPVEGTSLYHLRLVGLQPDAWT